MCGVLLMAIEINGREGNGMFSSTKSNISITDVKKILKKLRN